jgi:hypothetical protein
VKPELSDAMRAAWSHYYLLGDVTNGLDKAVRGLPGESAVSQTQRGIKGDVLTRGLESAIRKNGRVAVEQALGGADRLNTLYQIGQETSTNAGRQRLNQALVNVAKYLPEPTPYAPTGKPAGSKLLSLVPEAFGAAVGWHFGGFIGSRVGREVAKEATETAVDTVQKAVMANPKIAKQLIYAAKQGADPAKYGPIIAALIGSSRRNNVQEEQPQ